MVGILVVKADEHDLVPIHEVLSEEEKAELLKRLKATEKEIPIIRKSDPALKKIKKVNEYDIVKITRQSILSKESIYYRIVRK